MENIETSKNQVTVIEEGVLDCIEANFCGVFCNPIREIFVK